jgi:hypothetical protein
MGFIPWLTDKIKEFGMVDHSTHLSKNFSIREFEKSQTALRKNIPNKMGPVELMAARLLAEKVLQPVRDHFGPTSVSSGFRSNKLNKEIGGSKTSQHRFGEAADIEVPGVSNYDLAVWIRDNLTFDQLILEAYEPGEPNSGWVHVSYRRGINRKEALTAEFVNDNAQYSVGLTK